MAKFLKIRQVAEELNVAEKTLWNWRAAGKLNVNLFGRAVRVSQEEVDRLISESREPARAN